MICRKITIEIDPTPKELAFAFAIMSQDEQAHFFSDLAKITANWERPFCFQLQSIIDSDKLTNAGRRLMETIGAYGKTEVEP